MIKVKKLSDSARVPTKAHDGDLGYDLYADEDVELKVNSSELIGTGIAIKMPVGWGLFIKDRSSYAAKHKLETAAGVIDNGYRGEIKVVMRNQNSDATCHIEVGDRIAQVVPIPVYNFKVEEVNQFEEIETSRNEGGFGSTGK